MKTIVIWNEFGAGPEGLRLRYFTLDGDYSRFSGIFINHIHCNPVIQDELICLLYDSEGEDIIKMSNEFPLNVVKEGDCIVIEAGFLP